MNSRIKGFIGSMLIITLGVSLVACGNTNEDAAGVSEEVEVAETQAFVSNATEDDLWVIEVSEAKIANNLQTVAHVKQYDQSVMDVNYENHPSDGMEYLLINMNVIKQQAGKNAFMWNDVYVLADGNEYHRGDDVFLDDHEYKRMAGNDLQFGENEGWICIEVPQSIQTPIELHYMSDGNERSVMINL